MTSLRPDGRPRGQALEPTPLVARRREDVDHDRARVAAGHGVRGIRRDPPDRPALERPFLVPDPEDDGALEHDPELLVDVRMLGQCGARLDLDHRERELLAVDGTGEVAVAQELRRDRRQLVEGARLVGHQPSAARGCSDSSGTGRNSTSSRSIREPSTWSTLKRTPENSTSSFATGAWPSRPKTKPAIVW